MYTAYGDESADETKQRVFAMAGLFGNESDWGVFRENWGARTGGNSFHATDCDTDNGDYKHTSHEENKQLYADLTNIIAESKLLGDALAINIADYNELIAPRLNKEPYYFAFNSVVIKLARQSACCIPRDHIKFIFDRNAQIEHNAAELYGAISARNFPSRELMHDEVAFVTRKEIGIQAADLIAREAMKLLDNRIGPKKRATRMSTQVLLASKRINFRQYDRERFELLIEVQMHSQTGYSNEELHSWLSERGLYDTPPNRLKYEATRQDLHAKMKKLFDEPTD